MPKQSNRQGWSSAALSRTRLLVPGILLCGAITVVSLGVQAAEEQVFNHSCVEALVIAILLGMAIATSEVYVDCSIEGFRIYDQHNGKKSEQSR